MTVSEVLRSFIRTPFVGAHQVRPSEEVRRRGVGGGDLVLEVRECDFTHISYTELEAVSRRMHRAGLIDREQLAAMEQANVGWSYAADGRRIRVRVGPDGRLVGDDERFDFAAHLAKEIKLTRAYRFAHEARFRSLSDLLALVSPESALGAARATMTSGAVAA